MQSGLNFSAVLLFAIDSLMYNSGFAIRRQRERKKKADDDDEEDEPLFRSYEFYAEVLFTDFLNGGFSFSFL